MQFICPVSNKKINETTARFTAFLSFTLLIVFIVTTIEIFLWFLAVDFFIRALAMGKYSLLAALSKQLYNITRKSSAMLNAGPKIFAARIGFFLCAAAILFWYTPMGSISILLLSVLALFCFLEAVFGFCMACVIYPFLYRIVYRSDFND